MKKKRKYTPRTGEAAIVMMQRIRGRNNRLWMRLLKLAVKSKPREAKKIIDQIVKNDKEVTRWMGRI